VAVEHGRDVDVHDVAGPDHPVSGHAVRGLLVHADAGRAGEVVDRLRGGARTVLIEEAPADLVELARRHARLDRIEHLLQHNGYDAADGLEALDVTFRLDGHSSSPCRPIREWAARLPSSAACPVGSTINVIPSLPTTLTRSPGSTG